MKNKQKILICIIAFLLTPILVNASVFDQLSGGVFGRFYFGNTQKWFQLDPRNSEYYDLNPSFGFFIQAFPGSVAGLEAGILSWSGEYQTEFYYNWPGEGITHEYDKKSLNSISPYISIVIRPVKYLFASVGKYFSNKTALKNNFFLRAGVKFPVKKGGLPISFIGFGDYYLNKNDGENFWSLNLGVQLN